ncbi:chloride channel protein [Fundidesulfovibrio butyratiphilus]
MVDRSFTPWRIRQRLFGSSILRWLTLSVMAGTVAGLLTSGYSVALTELEKLFQYKAFGYTPAHAYDLFGLTRPWLVPLCTTLVGALTGLCIERFAPEAAEAGTDGTDAMIRAFHRNEGRIRPAAAVLRTVSSLLTMTAGGSAGKEGPVAFMGAGAASWLAQKRGLSAKDRRILLLAGAAGGLGAIFQAPLGGALTAVEVLYSDDFEAEALLPSVIASVTAYTVVTLFFGAKPVFDAPSMHLSSFLEIPFYLVLAGACALSAWFYVRGFFFTKYKIFAPLRARLGLPATTALGGLGAGLVGMAFPSLMGSSHTSLELAILGQLPALTLAALLLGKIVATSLTIGSGFSGGMFAPGLFVGAMTGGVVGQLGHSLRPDVVTQPGAFALVGMSAFFAAAANASIGPVVMVCEITQGYGLLAPLLLSSAIALMLSGKRCLYENQLHEKNQSPAHRGEAAMIALGALTVGQAYKPGGYVVLEQSTTLGALSDIIANTDTLTFAVRNAEGHLTSLLSLKDVRRVMFEDCLFPLVVVHDLARPLALLTPDQDLRQALAAFVDSGLSQLPVVDTNNPDRVLGMLRVEDLLAAQRVEPHV